MLITTALDKSRLAVLTKSAANPASPIPIPPIVWIGITARKLYSTLIRNEFSILSDELIDKNIKVIAERLNNHFKVVMNNRLGSFFSVGELFIP